jgi:hypothetical protein
MLSVDLYTPAACLRRECAARALLAGRGEVRIAAEELASGVLDRLESLGAGRLRCEPAKLLSATFQNRVLKNILHEMQTNLSRFRQFSRANDLSAPQTSTWQESPALEREHLRALYEQLLATLTPPASARAVAIVHARQCGIPWPLVAKQCGGTIRGARNRFANLVRRLQGEAKRQGCWEGDPSSFERLP